MKSQLLRIKIFEPAIFLLFFSLKEPSYRFQFWQFNDLFLNIIVLDRWWRIISLLTPKIPSLLKFLPIVSCSVLILDTKRRSIICICRAWGVEFNLFGPSVAFIFLLKGLILLLYSLDDFRHIIINVSQIII